MKKYHPLLLIALLFLLGCKHEMEVSLCTEPECMTYQEVWEARMRQYSGLSQSYIDAHIHPMQTRISEGPSGTVFGIEFMATIDWADVEGYDGFYIRLNADDTLFTDPMMLHEVYLTEADILQAMLDYPDLYAAPFIAPIEELKYDSKAEAMKALRKGTDGALNFHSIIYAIGDFAGLPNNGHPYLMAEVGKRDHLGHVTYGIIDLVTGEIVIEN